MGMRKKKKLKNKNRGALKRRAAFPLMADSRTEREEDLRATEHMAAARFITVLSFPENVNSL
jgi:hypothetical protein